MATTYLKKVNGKLQSPYYYAVYNSADGKRASKSTGLTKKRKAQEKATKEEQLKEYVLNMAWDVMTNCLPTMGVRTVNDFDKLDRMIRRAIDTTNQWGSIG